MIPAVVFLAIILKGETPQDVILISGPGYVRFVAFLLIAAAMFMFYDEELFVSAKRLAFSGIVLNAIAITRTAEEVIASAYKGELGKIIIPPFYHTPQVLMEGVRSLGGRSGAILVILSSIMVFSIVYSQDFETASRLALLLAHISIPSIILLSGAIVAHPQFLQSYSPLAVEIIKTVVLLPIFSLIIIDTYLALETTSIRE